MNAAWVVLLAAAGPLAAGCIAAEPTGSWELAGTFTRQATQADMDEFGSRAESYGGAMAVMESYPAQFRVSGLSAAGCADLRTEAVGLAYVAEVGGCRESKATHGAGDAATSSSHDP